MLRRPLDGPARAPGGQNGADQHPGPGLPDQGAQHGQGHLVRPVGRTRLLASKMASATTFCLIAAATVAVAGLVAGAVLFPLGRVTTPVPVQVDNWARLRLIVKTTLLHRRETEQEREQSPMEWRFDWEPDV